MSSPTIDELAACGRVAVVVPTVGRPSLQVLLSALAEQHRPLARIVVVDDRPDSGGSAIVVPEPIAAKAEVVRSGGRGPAAARNAGWRSTDADWVVFVDDDVVPSSTWSDDLVADLSHAGDAAGIQGGVHVPLPVGRAPTDAERNTALLATAEWITADLAVRRPVLERLSGFDERFPRAYREDTDFALRLRDAGYRLAHGSRSIAHPVRPDPWWASVSRQRGNGDDVLLSRLHGHGRVATGRRPRHMAIVASMAAAVMAAAARRPSLAAAAAAAWCAGTVEFVVARTRRGHHGIGELASMVVTSIAIPPAAVSHWLLGQWRWRSVGPQDQWPAGRTSPDRRLRS